MSEDGNTTNPVNDNAISTCLRTIIASILMENGIEENEDSACLAILEQIMLKSMMKHAALTQSFAEHAMRSQAHFADAIMAVAFTGVDIPRLKTYSREFRFPRALEGAKLVPEPEKATTTPIVFQVRRSSDHNQ